MGQCDLGNAEQVSTESDPSCKGTEQSKQDGIAPHSTGHKMQS
jgi:hypothetical protein